MRDIENLTVDVPMSTDIRIWVITHNGPPVKEDVNYTALDGFPLLFEDRYLHIPSIIAAQFGTTFGHGTDSFYLEGRLHSLSEDPLVSVPQYRLSGELQHFFSGPGSQDVAWGCCDLIGRPLLQSVGSWLSLIQPSQDMLRDLTDMTVPALHLRRYSVAPKMSVKCDPDTQFSLISFKERSAMKKRGAGAKLTNPRVALILPGEPGNPVLDYPEWLRSQWGICLLTEHRPVRSPLIKL
ncbi:hypothetical protein F5146DRAFT_1004910 [Armillaria mellea]|nr:hypothetical protein F5146DRAFT_1004910 [Armillaria mellea]